MIGIIEDLTAKVNEQKKNIERQTLTVKELAQVMGIGENSARQLTRRKGFPVIRVGSRILIPIRKFEDWLNNEAIGQQL